MTSISSARALVVVKTTATAGGYALAIWGVHTRVLSVFIPSPLLSLATAFVLVQSSVIGLLATVLVGRKLRSELLERRARRLQAPILDELVSHAAGTNRSAELSRWYQRHPAHVERCLAEILPTIAGISHDRLSQLAMELGVFARWERQSRSRWVATRRVAIASLGCLSRDEAVPALISALDDPEPEIRIAAACNALHQAPTRLTVERVFDFAIRAPLLARAMLADELRPHALTLANDIIPSRLESGNRDEVLVTLELIEAWGRALPLPGVSCLLLHDHWEIRARALRVSPLVTNARHIEEGILARLHDNHARVRAAAAFAAGRKMMRSADTLLADCLRDPHPEVALAAGFALAELGPTGVQALEREIVSSHRAAAVAAVEALERVKIGRCDYARL